MNAASLVSGAELDALLPRWEELAARTQASPFLHPGWVRAWWSAFGAGALELRVVRRGDGGLCALLPVRRTHGALLSPTNWQSPEFGLLSESAEATRELLGALFRGRPRRVSLAFLDPGQAALLRTEATSRSYRVIQRTLQRSPYVAIDGRQDWDAYLGGLSKNLRADLRRRQRLIAARGVVSFEVTSSERLDALLAEGFALEASGWKGASGTAINSQPATLRFYTEIARWAAARGWLRLAFLRLDGRALAFDYCLEHAGVHWMLKTGYDPAFAELSPGKLIRHDMLARAFRAGLRSYELLGDEEPWKLQWARETRARELVQSFSPSALGTLDWSLFAYGRPLARRVRALARRDGRAAPPDSSAGRESLAESAASSARAPGGT